MGPCRDQAGPQDLPKVTFWWFLTIFGVPNGDLKSIKYALFFYMDFRCLPKTAFGGWGLHFESFLDHFGEQNLIHFRKWARWGFIGNYNTNITNMLPKRCPYSAKKLMQDPDASWALLFTVFLFLLFLFLFRDFNEFLDPSGRPDGTQMGHCFAGDFWSISRGCQESRGEPNLRVITRFGGPKPRYIRSPNCRTATFNTVYSSNEDCIKKDLRIEYT